MQTYAALLRDRRVAAIWLGETLNAFGSGLTFWALVWLLLRAFPALPLLAAGVLSVLSVSGLLGTLGLGAWLDRWDRRRVLILCNLLLAALTALMPLAVRPGPGPWPLLALTAVIGALRSLPAPALNAALPSLTSPERLHTLLALFNSTWMLGELLAPLAAGFLISGLGASAALWLDACTYLAAALIYASVRLPLRSGPEPSAGGLPAWWALLRAGWGFVLGRSALWGVFLGLGATNAYFEVYGALFLPRVGERLLGAARGPLGVGVLEAVSVGVELLSSLWLGRAALPLRSVRPLILLGCVLPLLSAAALVLAPNFPAALGLALLGGLGFAPLGVLVGVYVARYTPEPLLGRVGSVRFFFAGAGRPLAMLAAGGLLPLLGLGPVAVLLAGVGVLLSVFGYRRGGTTAQEPPA